MVLKYLPLPFVGVVGWFFVTEASAVRQRLRRDLPPRRLGREAGHRQVSRAPANDGLFPRAFAWTDRNDTAWFGVVAAAALPSLRVVASPGPLGLVKIQTVRSLADAGALVVCGGGGGVPVVRSSAGELTGVEAVVDKDLTVSEMAITLKADRLLVLTYVPGIIRGYGTLDAQPIQAIDTVALSAMTFPAGSMGPKVDACIRFVLASGQPAAIGALADAADILVGRAGTTIDPP